MNIVSILITLIGIIALLALYIISKLSQQKQRPKSKIIVIPKLHDENGLLMSSILADIPATDGSTPPPVVKIEKEKKPIADQQLVLFIAFKEENGIKGEQIPPLLEQHNLSLGKQDIYHYFVDKKKKESLFRVANAVAPWVLTPSALEGTQTPGLSMVMQLPSTFVSDHSALELFIRHAEDIAVAFNGQLKNDQQEVFSSGDKEALLSLAR